jgi:hypothetical protein
MLKLHGKGDQLARTRLWSCLVIPLLLILAGHRADASGTYYRPGVSAVAHNAALNKGQFRVGVRADFQRFSKERLFNGLTAQVAEVRLRTYTLSAEYGLTMDSSLYTAIPYVDNDSAAKNAPTFAKESGLGDMKIGYNKAFPLNRNTSVVGTAEVTFPLRNYKTTELTAPGDNSVDLLTHVAIRGDPIGGTPLFYTLGLGGKLRASQSPDQWLWDAEIGGHIGKVAALSTFLDSIDSGHGVGLGGPGFNGDFALLKQSLTRWGVRALFNVGRVDGELYYAKAIRFQNQSPSDYYGLALSGRF